MRTELRANVWFKFFISLAEQVGRVLWINHGVRNKVTPNYYWPSFRTFLSTCNVDRILAKSNDISKLC